MSKSERRKSSMARKRAAKARRMKDSGGKSRYARKKAWRDHNCGAPLPFFPDVMLMRVKPWGGSSSENRKAAA